MKLKCKNMEVSEHTFAVNNNERKNEPQAMKTWRIKLCLVLCEWLSENYKFLPASKT